MTKESLTLLNPDGLALDLSVTATGGGIQDQEADWRRWVVLLNFILISSANSMQWIILSPVILQSKEYFDMNSFQVDMLGLSYVLVYPLVSPMSTYCFERLGYKSTIALGGFLNLMAAVGRLVAVLWSPNFTNLMIAQVLAATAQATTIATPPVLADQWFPARERTMANIVGANSISFGIALGLLIPPLIVDEHNKGKEAFALLCGGFVVTYAASTFIFALLIPSESVIPMSPKAKKLERKAEELSALEEGGGSGRARSSSSSFGSGGLSVSTTTSVGEVFSSVKAAFKIPAFCLLLVVISVGVGSMWAFSTTYTQMFLPFGISEKEAGTMGFVNIVGGAVFAVVASIALDKYKLYKSPLMAAMVVVLVAEALILLVFQVVSSTETMYVLVFTFYTMMGLAQALVAGIGMEFGAELTFPISPAIVGALLMSTACLVSAAMTIAVAALLGDNPTKAEASSAMLIFIGTGAVATGCIIPIKGELKRLQHEGFN